MGKRFQGMAIFHDFFRFSLYDMTEKVASNYIIGLEYYENAIVEETNLLKFRWIVPYCLRSEWYTHCSMYYYVSCVLHLHDALLEGMDRISRGRKL